MSRDYASKAARLLLRRPFLPLAALLAVVAFFWHYIPQTKFSVGLDPYFPENSTLRATVDEVNETFVGDFNIVIVYDDETDDVFSYQALTNLKQLTERLAEARLPVEEGEDPESGVIIADDIVNLITVQDVESSDLSFRTIPLVPDEIPTEKAELEKVRQRALASHVVRENLISDEDPGIAAMVIRLPASFVDAQRAASVGVVRELVAANSKEAGVSTAYYFTGKPVIDADETAIIFRDLSKLIPLVYLVVLGLLFFYLLNFVSVFVSAVAAYLSMQFAHAVIPASGYLFTPTCGTVALLIVTLSGAFIIHYFSEQHKHRRNHPEEDRGAAIHRTVRGILPAAVIVALTTAAGFWTNAVTDIPALKEYSIVCALAILGTFVISVATYSLSAPLRALIANGMERTPLRVLVRAQEWISSRGIGKSRFLNKALGGLANLHIRHPKKMLATSVLIIAGVVAGMPYIGFGFDQLRNFHEDEPIRVATELMESHVGGSTEMIVSIGTENEDHFLNPVELKKLEELDAFFRDEIGADRVLSVADLAKHMHRGFFNNDPKEYRIPDTAQGTAQLFALNSDLRLYEYITPRHDRVRVVGRVPAQNGYELSKNYQKLDAFLAEKFPESEGYVASAAGQHRVYAAMTESITDSMTKSLLLAFVIIFGLLCIFFRSMSAGLFSVPPNIMPVVMILGLMGWLGIRLSAENAIFATICIGIAVDDTVHFIQYIRARLRSHGSIEEAIRETLQFKGPALIGTTVLMVSGFSVMFLSSFQQIINFGFVVSCGVGAALFGDLVLLPALILVTRSRLGIPSEELERARRPRRSFTDVLDTHPTFEDTSPGIAG